MKPIKDIIDNAFSWFKELPDDDNSAMFGGKPVDVTPMPNELEGLPSDEVKGDYYAICHGEDYSEDIEDGNAMYFFDHNVSK